MTEDDLNAAREARDMARAGLEQVAVVADDIADMAQDFITARDARSLRNYASNIARIARHFRAITDPEGGDKDG